MATPRIPDPFTTRRGTCLVAGCENPTRARGLCRAHHERWRRKGDAMAGTPIRKYVRKADR